MRLTDKETVDASLLGVELEVEIDWQVQHDGIVNNRQDDTGPDAHAGHTSLDAAQERDDA